MQLRRRPLYSAQSDVNRTATCVCVHVYERDVMKAGALLHPRLSRLWGSCHFLFLQRMLLAAVCVCVCLCVCVGGVLCILWPRQLTFSHFLQSITTLVKDVGLKPFARWDCGFESLRVVSVTIFSGRGLCVGQITCP
jgi:hypothetical protein